VGQNFLLPEVVSMLRIIIVIIIIIIIALFGGIYLVRILFA